MHKHTYDVLSVIILLSIMPFLLLSAGGQNAEASRVFASLSVLGGHRTLESPLSTFRDYLDRTRGLGSGAPAEAPLAAAAPRAVVRAMRVSVALHGTQGNDDSLRPSISAEGRYVAFTSHASNLVPDDTNNQHDVFVHDRQRGETTRVSVASDGKQGNGRSWSSSLSADGRIVAFYSDATNLVSDETTSLPAVFVHDRQTRQIRLVAMMSNVPSTSADGRYIAFESYATNLVADDNRAYKDFVYAHVFVHDQHTGEIVCVSMASDGTHGDNRSVNPSISADGRYVAFESSAANLVSDDTNGESDIFVHDRHTGETTRVSVATNGMQGNKGSVYPSISADGRYVAFASHASNLVPNDTNRYGDIFVHDRDTSETTRVSVASDGAEGGFHSGSPSISADGRYVAFTSHASNLVPDDMNETGDVFVHDRDTSETTRVSVASDGTEGDGNSGAPSISADGRYVAFTSHASNLAPNDTNGAQDVFIHDRQTGETTRVSVASDGTLIVADGTSESSTAPSEEDEALPLRQNGERIAAVKSDSNIALVHPDGGDVKSVTEDATGVVSSESSEPTILYLMPKWSPMGDQLAFLREERDSDPGQSDYSLLLYDPTSDQIETLVRGTGDGFDWGPEGERIVYELPSRAVLADPNDPHSLTWAEYGGLMLVDVESGQVWALVRPQNEAPLEEPDWAPDGSRLIFHDDRQCLDYCSHSIASARFQEPIDSYQVWDPDSHGFQPTCDWSPDSERLACVDAPFFLGPNCPVVVYDSRGGLLRELPNHDESCDIGPLWSRDGSAIAVGAAVAGDEFGMMDQYVDLLSPDGSGRRRVVEGRPLDWSPDGRKIVGLHEHKLFVVSVETGDTTWLIEGRDAAWQPAPLPEPTPEPSATPSVDAATPPPSPEPTTSSAEPTLSAPEAESSEDVETEAVCGLLARLMDHQAWLIGVGLAVMVALIVFGAIGGFLLRRHRPSTTRAVWIGCGVALLLLVLVAASAVATVGLGSRWCQTGSSGAEPTSAVRAKASETSSPTALAEARPDVTPTEAPPTREPPTPTVTPVPPTLSRKPSPTVDALVACAAAPRQGLDVGDQVYVCTQFDRLRARSEPGRSGAEVLLLDPGTPLNMTGGPACADGWLWWEVETITGATAWVPEGGDATDPYFICKNRPCEPVTGPFADVWSTAREEIGCSTGAAFVGLVAEEHFEGGVMLWRERLDTGRSPVLFKHGTWRYYAHEPFIEGSPDFSCLDENTPPRCPPTPKRGFGMMWCSIPEIRTRLGDATDCERGYQGLMREFDRGSMLRTDTGAIYVLFNDGTWERR